MPIASCFLSPDLTREGIYAVLLREFCKQSLIQIKAKTAWRGMCHQRVQISEGKVQRRRSLSLFSAE